MMITEKVGANNNYNRGTYKHPNVFKIKRQQSDFKRILDQYMHKPNLYGVVADGKPCVVTMYGECVLLNKYIEKN
jgi:hypothetical protein